MSTSNEKLDQSEDLWVKCSDGYTPSNAFYETYTPLFSSFHKRIYAIRASTGLHTNIHLSLGGLIPGMLDPSRSKLGKIPCGELEIDAKECEVLCNFSGKWTECPKEKIPTNALKGGHENEETLYIGKVYSYYGEIYFGKVRPSDMCCYIPKNGRVEKYTSFEILVKE